MNRVPKCGKFDGHGNMGYRLRINEEVYMSEKEFPASLKIDYPDKLTG